MITLDEKRGLLELICWIVDDLECTYPVGVDRGHAERIANMRRRLGELGPYAKKPYTAPKLPELDAADVVERLLDTLSVEEIQMVLGRVAVRRHLRERESEIGGCPDCMVLLGTGRRCDEHSKKGGSDEG
jgi:hypothetical protein